MTNAKLTSHLTILNNHTEITIIQMINTPRNYKYTKMHKNKMSDDPTWLTETKMASKPKMARNQIKAAKLHTPQ